MEGVPDWLGSRLGDGSDRFVITGASGWLGRVALELLADAMTEEGFVRRVSAVAGSEQAIVLRSGRVVTAIALADAARLLEPADHILHFGYLTKDRVSDLGVERYVTVNIGITGAVLALIERWRPKGLFYASSGAVYGRAPGLETDVSANPYGALKHIDELVLRRACADMGSRSVVARVFSVAGAYMTKPELYALGDMIRQARTTGTIAIRTARPVFRSFMGVADLVTLGLASLLAGDGQGVWADDDDVVFDSGGPVLEMAELAAAVGDALGIADLRVTRSLDPGLEADRYVGDPAECDRRLRRHGIRPTALADLIRQTAAGLPPVG
jgi:nucleoside-diphosphate-sugar epimerase